VARHIVCSDCVKKFNLVTKYRAACVHVLANQGDESNCDFCGLPNGGADIDVPEIIEQTVAQLRTQLDKT
jgi:hypothetical protein